MVGTGVGRGLGCGVGRGNVGRLVGLGVGRLVGLGVGSGVGSRVGLLVKEAAGRSSSPDPASWRRSGWPVFMKPGHKLNDAIVPKSGKEKSS